MSGRLETEIKKENNIINKLNNAPEYVTNWYYNLKASKRTAATCRDYINKIFKFLEFINPNIKDVKPEDITLKITQKYFISIQTKEINGARVYTSDSYQQTVWCCLNNFFEFLVYDDVISKNYMDAISKPKNNDLERINENRILLTKKDFNKILDSVRKGVGSHKAKAFQERLYNRNMLILLLFMTTGMRKTALSEINIDDIDFNEETLTVIDKGDKRHTYTLSEKVINCLYDWLEDREEWNPKTDALLITEDGTRISPSAITKLVEMYCEDALGYHISPHKLRAGFCSILYKETGNAEFVRRAVGHSNIATTQRYIVTNNEERKQASELISNILK